LKHTFAYPLLGIFLHTISLEFQGDAKDKVSPSEVRWWLVLFQRRTNLLWTAAVEFPAVMESKGFHEFTLVILLKKKCWKYFG